MSNIYIRAIDTKNYAHILSNLISLNCRKAYDTPAHSLVCEMLIDKKLPELMEILLFYDNTVLFSGFIDSQSLSISASGLALTITARSKASLLLDNEAVPMTFTNACLDDIFSTYIAEHSIFKLNYNRRAFLYQYLVSKGMSQWEAFSNFCKISTGLSPYVDDYQNICLSPRSNWSSYSVSNSTSGINYLSIKQIRDRYPVISQIYIRDSDGYYSSVVNNSEALAHHIRRRRYITTPTNYETAPKMGADQIIKNSMKNKLSYEVVFSDFQKFNIGDFIDIKEKLISENKLFISEIKYSISNNGFYTAIKLIDYKYI